MTVQIDTPDPEDVLVQPLWELTLLALEEGLDLHRLGEEPQETLPGTLAMTALDVTLAMLVRHPVWTHRLAELHRVVLEGKGADGRSWMRWWSGFRWRGKGLGFPTQRKKRRERFSGGLVG